MGKQKGNLFWQLYAYVYDLMRFLPPYQNLLKDVHKAAGLKPNTRVLDAGCGTGNFIQQVASKTNAEFIGIDVSEIMLAKARKKIGHLKNVKLLWGNINDKLSYPNNYFDCIIATNSLYAVTNPRFTLSELLRVLKPKGIVVIVNPHAKAKLSTMYLQILDSGKGFGKLRLFFISLPLFFFNLIIKRKANKKAYHFLSMQDWESMIKSLPITSLTIKETYMQGYLLKIIK